MSILDTTFAVETADRGIKSFFQGLLAVFAISDVGPVNAFKFDWTAGLGGGLAMLVLSVATSFASGSIFKRAATPASMLSSPPLPADEPADRGQSAVVTLACVAVIVVAVVWLLSVYR